MSSPLAAGGTIAPAELLERLGAGAPVTILDVREDPSWGIEAPGARVLRRPSPAILEDPAATAEGLSGPVVVVCGRGRTARRVADALEPLGVAATVLDGGMRGWIGALRAVAVPVAAQGLALYQVQRPGRGCLSYLVAHGGEALVVDPAPDAGFYLDLADRAGARIAAVLDTHLHADHLSGARELADRSGAALRLPVAALERGVAYAERVRPLADGEDLGVGGAAMRAISLPGHTTDMTGVLLEHVALISGDSLFADGIARPDLQRGDPDGARAMARTLHATLHERILSLPGELVLLPGHTHPGVPEGAVAPRLEQVRAVVAELALADPEAFADALLADMPPRPQNYETVIAVNAGMHPFDPELEQGGNSCSTSR